LDFFFRQIAIKPIRFIQAMNSSSFLMKNDIGQNDSEVETNRTLMSFFVANCPENISFPENVFTASEDMSTTSPLPDASKPESIHVNTRG